MQRKLTAEEVLEIRSLYTRTRMSQAAIGRRFGITQTCVGSIVRGETHLEPGWEPAPRTSAEPSPTPPSPKVEPEPETEKPDAKGDMGRFAIRAKFAAKIGASLIPCPQALPTIVETLMRMSDADLCTLRSRVDALRSMGAK